MNLTRIIAVILALSVIVGCSSGRDRVARFGGSRDPGPPEYRIQPGDVLDIKFYYNPELNEQLTVRPDGRISLQLAQDVVAAGLTPAELTRMLKDKYVDLDHPEIAVILRSFNGQRVYVDGEVNHPGPVNITGPTTVFEAISQAGGLKESARTDQILVMDREREKRALLATVNLEKVFDGSDLNEDIYLQPFDIVFVPRSKIANVDQWVDQYVRKIIPFSFGVAAPL